jgi:hypothetical protein
MAPYGRDLRERPGSRPLFRDLKKSTSKGENGLWFTKLENVSIIWTIELPCALQEIAGRREAQRGEGVLQGQRLPVVGIIVAIEAAILHFTPRRRGT